MEKLSFIGAAQRLGVSVEEIEKMIKEKRLEEVSRGKVSKEAVYALSGLSSTAKQTKKKAGRKPNTLRYKETKEILGIDDEGLAGLIKNGELEEWEMDDGKFGITERSVKMRKERVENREEPVKKRRTDKAEPDTEAMVTDNKKESVGLEDNYTPLEGEEDAKTEAEEESVVAEVKRDTDDTQKSGSDLSNDPDVASEKNNEKNKEAGKETVSNSKDKEEEKKDHPKEAEEEEILAFALENMMQEIFPGIQRLDPDVRDEMIKKCERQKETITINKKDFKAAMDVAAMRGELEVYRSMQRFERKVRG